MAGPLLLGHRGARCRAPENTLAAFRLALVDGCDGFEFDVRCARDQKLVLCHDATFGGREVAATASAVLGSAPALDFLDPVLREFATSAYLDMEIKACGYEHLIAEALRRTPPRRGFLVSSFLPEVLEKMSALAPELPLGWICDDARVLERWKELPIAALVAHHSLATPKLVEQTHACDKQFFVWTLNNAGEMRRLAGWDVEAIISDDTALLAQTLGRRRFAGARDRM